MPPKSSPPPRKRAAKPSPAKPAPVSKAKASVSAAPVAAPVVEKPVESAAQPEEAQMDELGGRFTEFLAKIQNIATQMSALKSEFRGLEKAAMREMKLAKKLSQKKKRKNTNRAPSGFVKPTLISTELATFLGKPTGTEMARTEVTREINKYIRSHDLQDKTNGRKINPDDKLRSLLKLKKNDELTYFNLQRYMSPHFAKQNKAESASASS